MHKNTTELIQSQLQQLTRDLQTIKEEFEYAKDYVHPDQVALINASKRIVELRIDNETLQKRVSELEGYLVACQEELQNKGKTDPLKGAAMSKTQPTTDEKKKLRGYGFDSIDFEVMNMQFDLTDMDAENSGNHNNNNNNNNNDRDETQRYHGKPEVIEELAENMNGIRKQIVTLQHLVNDPEILSGVGIVGGGGGGGGGGGRYGRGGGGGTHVGVSTEVTQQISEQLMYVMDRFDELGTKLAEAQQIISPDSNYVYILEQRYQQVKGLYKMKFAECENLNDSVYQHESRLQDKNKEVNELKDKIRRIETSAASDPEIRMDWLKQGTKVQTYESIMKFFEDEISKAKQCMHGIQSMVSNELVSNIIKTLDHDQRHTHRETGKHVEHNCEVVFCFVLYFY